MLKTDFTKFKLNRELFSNTDRSRLRLVITEEDKLHRLLLDCKRKREESDKVVQRLSELKEQYRQYVQQQK